MLLAFESDIATHQADIIFHNIQPEAGPLDVSGIPGTEKCIEEPRLIVFRDADALVFNNDRAFGGRNCRNKFDNTVFFRILNRVR